MQMTIRRVDENSNTPTTGHHDSSVAKKTLKRIDKKKFKSQNQKSTPIEHKASSDVKKKSNGVAKKHVTVRNEKTKPIEHNASSDVKRKSNGVAKKHVTVRNEKTKPIERHSLAAAKKKKNETDKKKVTARKEKTKHKRLATSAAANDSLPTRVLLRNLPQSVTYAMLANLAPTAVHYELYKKHKKRNAFVRFADSETCARACTQLNGMPVEDHQLRATFAGDSLKKCPAPPDNDQYSDRRLTISNLPFKVTLSELKEEFPTASQIVMNINSHGRFRGSCLLEFESADDCSVMLQACRGKRVADRPIKCLPGVHFTLQNPENKDVSQKQQKYVLKVTNLPLDMKEKRLRSVFGKTLLDVRLSVDSSEVKKTVLMQFDRRSSMLQARSQCNGQKVLGADVKAKHWAPRNNDRKFKLIPPAPVDCNDTEMPSESPDKPGHRKSKKRPLSDHTATPVKKATTDLGDSRSSAAHIHFDSDE